MKRLLTFISLILCLCATSLAQDVKVSGPKKRSTNNKPQVKSEANKAQTQNTSVQDRQIEGPDSWFYEGYKYDQANDYVQAVLWYRKAAEKGHLFKFRELIST